MVKAQSYLNNSVRVIELIILIGNNIFDRNNFTSSLCACVVLPSVLSEDKQMLFSKVVAILFCY